jgi:cytoskeleton-associated protein 5
MVPRQIPAATGPADWREALEIVALGLPEQVMLSITSHSSTYPIYLKLCSLFFILYFYILRFYIHSLNRNIGLIYAFRFLQSVEGMKVICHELTQAADPESTVLEDLIKEADRLVSCLAVMVSICCVIHVLFS